MTPNLYPRVAADRSRWAVGRIRGVWIHANQRGVAIRKADLVEARARQLERLCRGRLRQRQSAMTIRIDDLDPCRGIAASRRSGAQGNKRIHQSAAADAFTSRKIACCAINKRYKRRTHRQVVGQVVQSGGEQQHMALSNLLLHQQWCLIREPHDYARTIRIHTRDVINLQIASIPPHHSLPDA